MPAPSSPVESSVPAAACAAGGRVCCPVTGRARGIGHRLLRLTFVFVVTTALAFITGVTGTPAAAHTAAATGPSGSAQAAPAEAAPAEENQPAPAENAPGQEKSPVVVIGAAGLSMSDLSPDTTPHLWRFAAHADLSNLSVRTTGATTCPAAAWLTLGSGERTAAVDLSADRTASAQRNDDSAATDTASDPEPTTSPAPIATSPATDSEEEADRLATASCPDLNQPGTTGENVTIPGFDRIADANVGNSYSTGVGQLALTAHESGVCVEAIGPGAAWAAADAQGRVGLWKSAGTAPGTTPAARHANAGGQGLCPLTLIDAGSMGAAEWTADSPVGSHAEQVAAVDAAIGDYLSGLDLTATTVHIAGLGDLGNPPRLRALLSSTPATATGVQAPGILESSSTRKPVLQLTDLTGVVLNETPGIDPVLAPTPVALTRTDAGQPAAERISALTADATAAASIHRSAQTFSIVTTTAFYVLVVAAGVLLARPFQAWWARRRGLPRHTVRRRVRTGLGWTGLVLGCLPMGSFLAAALPWSRLPNPVLGLGLAVAAGTGLLLATAFIGPWRRTFAGRVAAICTVTAAALIIDVAVFGSHLQYNALMGYNAIVAGRFYGLGNQGAALLIVALFLALGLTAQHFAARAAQHLAARAAQHLAARADRPLAARADRPLAARADRRGPVVLFLAIVGLTAVGVLGNPVWGAKFGGTIATLSGLCVLLAIAARVRLSLWRLAAIGGLSVAVILGIAGLDYLRPPAARSHFGGFFAQLVSGEALEVISRKLSANLNIIVVNPGMAIIVPLAALAILVILGALRWFPATARLARPFDGVLPEALTGRLARAGFLAVCTGLLVGLVITDSGVAVPGTGAMMFVPFLLALSADVPVDPAPEAVAESDSPAPEAVAGSGSPGPEAVAGSDSPAPEAVAGSRAARPAGAAEADVARTRGEKRT